MSRKLQINQEKNGCIPFSLAGVLDFGIQLFVVEL